MRRNSRGLNVKLLLVTSALSFGLSSLTVMAQDRGSSTAGSKDLFNSRCALCHGADGHGSDMGKTLKVKDLTSKEVQSQSDEELAHVIAEGKNNMPPFKGSLKKEEISDVIKYLRTLK